MQTAPGTDHEYHSLELTPTPLLLTMFGLIITAALEFNSIYRNQLAAEPGCTVKLIECLRSSWSRRWACTLRRAGKGVVEVRPGPPRCHRASPHRPAVSAPRRPSSSRHRHDPQGAGNLIAGNFLIINRGNTAGAAQHRLAYRPSPLHGWHRVTPAEAEAPSGSSCRLSRDTPRMQPVRLEAAVKRVGARSGPGVPPT